MNTLPALIVRMLVLIVAAIGAVMMGFKDATTGTIMLVTFWTAMLLCVITGTQIVSHIRRPPPPMPKSQPVRGIDQTRRFMTGNGAELTSAERMRRSIKAEEAEIETDRNRPLTPPWPTVREPDSQRTWPMRNPRNRRHNAK